MNITQRKIALANYVLTVLEEDEEWTADTIEVIADYAYVLDLAVEDDNGFFAQREEKESEDNRAGNSGPETVRG